MLDNDIVRFGLAALAVFIGLWAAMRFILDWQRDEPVYVDDDDEFQAAQSSKIVLGDHGADTVPAVPVSKKPMKLQSDRQDPDVIKDDVIADIKSAEEVEESLAVEKDQDVPVKKVSKVEEAVPPKAVVDEVVDPSVKDNLTKIEGIGPKIQELLNDADIYTFAQLAKKEPADIEVILRDAGKRFVMHDPATWPSQSAIAARGAWGELDTLQDNLKGGRSS